MQVASLFSGNSGRDFYFMAQVRNHETDGSFFECFPGLETGKHEKRVRRFFHSANVALTRNVFTVSGQSIKNVAAQFLRRNLSAELGERFNAAINAKYILGGGQNVDLASAKIYRALFHPSPIIAFTE